MIRIYYLLCTAWIICSNLSANESNMLRIISPAEMRADIDYFFDFVAEVHPNMYAFVSKDSMDRRREALYHICSKPMQVWNFQRYVTQLNGMFDGHTKILPNSWGWEKNSIFFPSSVRIIDGELFFVGNGYNHLKCKILSINNVPASDLCNMFFNVSNLENKQHSSMQIEYNFSRYLFSTAALRPQIGRAHV